MKVGRVSEDRADRVEVHRPVVARRHRRDRGAGDDRVAGALVEDRVRLGFGDDLAAAGDVRHVRHEVAHRPARDEEAGLLARQLGGSLLERDDGRVVAEDVVADLGFGHRAPHPGRGPRDRVGAQVDDGRAWPWRIRWSGARPRPD